MGEWTYQLCCAALIDNLAVGLAPPLLLDHGVHLQALAVLAGVLDEGQGHVGLAQDLPVLLAVFVVIVQVFRCRSANSVVGSVGRLAEAAVVCGQICKYTT